MQAFHCWFALGGVVAPLIVRPFLAPDSDQTGGELAGELDFNDAIPQNNISLPCFNTPLQLVTNVATSSPGIETEIWMSYLLTGCLVVLSALSFFIVLIVSQKQMLSQAFPANKKDVDIYPLKPKHYIITLAFSTWVLCFSFCVLEVTCRNYIFSYAVEYLYLSKDTAAYVDAAFWLGFLCGRIVGIFIIRCLPTSVILFAGNIIICMSLMILVFLVNVHTSIIWICVTISSFALGPVFAATITWLQTYIEVKGLIGSGFVVAGYLGGGVGPIILGALASEYGYVAFGYMILVDSLISLTIFICLQAYAWKYQKV